MAARILPELKLDLKELKLIPGKGGCYEIWVDGDKIYSKLETGEHADEDEMVKQILARNG